ncbi:uridine kinase [Spirochaetia bacterium]|nr:uridine kinase [Spirochaetia bacterium]
MDKKPYIIGLAGGTCSGKSTAAEKLKAGLAPREVRVINMDTYFMNPPATTIAPITGIEYVEHNHPKGMRLDELYADFEAAIKAKPDFVIIDGLFAFHLEKIRNALDLKVFVDLKSDERLVRRIRRFTQKGQSFDEIVNRYLDTVRYRHDELIEPTRWHADIVLNGIFDKPNNKGLTILLSYLKSL